MQVFRRLKKKGGRVWIELIWHRIGTSEGFCKDGNENL
jgi:hypothetical protein